MSIPKLGGERSGGDRPYSDKPGDKTRDKIRSVLGKASANTGLGKLPPQAVDLEEAVLGALMLEKDALTTVIEILQVESFYREPHQKIYEAILMLFDNSEPVDILTVTNQLRKNGTLEFAGGPFYVSGLTQRVNSAANVEYHARIVSEKAIKRHLISIASEIEREAYEDTTDTFALLDKVEQDIFNVSEVNIRKNYADMRSMMREAITELEAKKHHKDGLTGVPTGFTNLDRLTSGWQKSDLVIIAARPAMGKCLGKGTKVVMYDGTLKKVEDVRVGDQLMGDDSTPRRVLSLARGRERMYWVRQNRGMDYRVNESHILSLKRSPSGYCRTEGTHTNGDVLNISVSDYLDKAPKFKTNYKGYKVAVEFDEKPVPIDPYFVGLWLGDGDRNSPRITTNDPEVVSYLQEYALVLAQEGHLTTLSTYDYLDRCNQYAITKGFQGGTTCFSIKDELRKLSLLGNKHIPNDYLNNTTSQRLTLLAGLIDSDGHYLQQSNGYEITQKNQRLSYQIKYLCDSLGFRTSLRKKKAVITAIGYESEVYRVRIYGDVHRIPVRIPRKKALPWTNRINWQVTGIKVEYDKVDDYYGFEIDGNHLFLLEDMTVTHNTAFVLSALRNAAVDFKHSVAIFSLEMSSIQLVNRLISAEAELESEKIKKGSLREDEWQQLYAKTSRLTEAPIFIDDTPALSIRELRSKCRRLKAQHNIELIIIDYLQLMTGDASRTGGGNREQEIASISRALKNIAKELEVPVIALSQLSRAVETRGGDKRPQLSDLRESGSIEQDADMVMFLYRPEYYGLTESEDGQPVQGVGEIIISKHRNGALDTVQLKFIGKFTKFTNLHEVTPGENYGSSLQSASMDDSFKDPGIVTFASKANDRPNDPGESTSRPDGSGIGAPPEDEAPF
ncbi:MAG: replicative DNA helicase [Tunicatimonas sp.]